MENSLDVLTPRKASVDLFNDGVRGERKEVSIELLSDDFLQKSDEPALATVDGGIEGVRDTISLATEVKEDSKVMDHEDVVVVDEKEDSNQDIIWGRLVACILSLSTKGARSSTDFAMPLSFFGLAVIHGQLHSLPCSFRAKQDPRNYGQRLKLVLGFAELPADRYLVLQELPADSAFKGVVGIINWGVNSVFVNDRPLKQNEHHPLSDGDYISLIWKSNKVYQYLETPNSFFPLELIRQYHISERIGNGSFGEVRVCVNRRTFEKRVCKIVKRVNDSSYKSKLVDRELQVMQMIDHQNIVKVFHCYQHQNDTCFFVMERAIGGDLCNRLSFYREGRLPEFSCKLYAFQTLLALQYLHGKQISHRDLKNENVLMMDTKLDCVAKLCDFGLSKINEGKNLRSVVGTCEYMAPEIVAGGKHYSPAVDLWSCGVGVFKCLAGEYPFKDPNIDDKILTGVPELDVKVWRKCSRNAWHFVKNLLNTDVEKRLTIEQGLKHAWFMDPTLIKVVSELGLKHDVDLSVDHVVPLISPRKGTKRQLAELSNTNVGTSTQFTNLIKADVTYELKRSKRRLHFVP